MAIENNKCWLTKNCNHIDCDKFCLRLYKLDYLYNQAFVNLPQRERINLYLDSNKCDYDNFVRLKKMEEDILNFVNTGTNLYIHSKTCGNGKTAWSLRLLQAYFDKIWYKSELKCKALFIEVPRFLLALKDNIATCSDYVQHIKDNVLDCDLVIWDEIGTKGLTQFEHENILNLINARINAGKSNIYTSNLDDSELHLALGDRLHSRIVNYSVDIVLYGKDKRGL